MEAFSLLLLRPIYFRCCCSIAPQSAIHFMGSTMSLPNTNCPGVAFNVVWKVLCIAYAAEDKKIPQGSFSSISLPSISAVLNESLIVKYVRLLPLPQPPLRARTDARTNPSAQRATQLRSVLARVYAVSRQNQITTTVP
jgi:hypothetical protein